MATSNPADRRWFEEKWILSLLFVTFGCGGEEPGADSSPKLTEMEQRLAKIAQEAEVDNPYFETASRAEARKALEALPAEGAPRRRWRALFDLGTHELRLGEFEASVEHLEAAWALADRPGAPVRPGERVQTLFLLAVANLRFGEVQNCIARHTSRSCIFPIQGDGIHVDQAGSRRAMELLLVLLERQPKSMSSRWLLNLAAMTVGGFPDLVPEPWRLPDGAVEAGFAFPRFTDIAPELGINDNDLSGGAVVEDLDNDGDLDIVTSSLDPSVPLSFYRNDGGGVFVQRRKESGLQHILGGLNLIQADYDNDGWIDLLVLRGAWWGNNGRHPNSLLRNLGDGRFEDVTIAAGLADPATATQTASWGDYDLDGDLDLYVGNESNEEHPFPGQLFRNDGDGTFTDVAAAAGVTNDRYAKSVIFGDADGDRWPDLYLSNLFGPNRLYHNNGDGTFTDRAEALGVTEPTYSFPAWFFDANNDGHLDIFVSEYRTDVETWAKSFWGMPNASERNRLYLNDGQGGFRDEASAWGLTRMTVSMGASFGDLDGDGWPDFYLGTGFPEYHAVMPNVMYRNRNGAGFEEVTIAGGFGHLQKGHGVAFADVDGDGDQDVFEQMGGAYPGDTFGNALYENPGFGHRWLKVRLVGQRSNRFGVGCRIGITIEEANEERTVWAWVNSGGSFGARTLRREIGLGDAERIIRLAVDWPASDTTQFFESVPLDSFVRITEGEDELEIVR